MTHMNWGKGQRRLICLSLVCTLCGWIAAACAASAPPPPASTSTPMAHIQTPTTQVIATSLPTACPRDTPQPTGIYSGDNGGFHELITNYAVIAPTPTRLIIYVLYAGAYKATPQQGLIIVTQLNSDPCASSAPGFQSAYYRTPTQQGAVTLTKIVGDTVTFTTAGGGSGTFNFVSGQYS